MSLRVLVPVAVFGLLCFYASRERRPMPGRSAVRAGFLWLLLFTAGLAALTWFLFFSLDLFPSAFILFFALLTWIRPRPPMPTRFERMVFSRWSPLAAALLLVLARGAARGTFDPLPLALALPVFLPLSFDRVRLRGALLSNGSLAAVAILLLGADWASSGRFEPALALLLVVVGLLILAPREGLRFPEEGRSQPGLFLILIIVAAVLVGAAYERRFLIQEGLWRDEAQAVRIARSESVALFLDRMPTDFNPPLFHAILAGAGRIIGFEEFPMKVLAMGLGLAVILAVALPAGELFGRSAAAIAACLAAVNPLLISLSGEVRPYSLTAILGCLSLWLILRLFREGRADETPVGATACLALVLTLLAYAHYTGLFMAGAIGVVALCAAAARPLERRRWTAVAAAAAFAGAAFLPWSPVLLRQARSGLPYARALSWNQIQDLLAPKLTRQVPFLWWARNERREATPGMTLIWFVALLAGIALLARGGDERARRRQIAALLVLVVSLVLVFAVGQAPQEPRYLVLVAALATSLIGGMLAAVGRARWLGRAFFLVAMASIVGSHLKIYTAWSIANGGLLPKSGIRTICRQGRLGPDDLVVLTPNYLGSTFWYYCGEGRNAHGFPIWPDPSLPDWFHYRERWSSPGIVAETAGKIRENLRETGKDRFRLIWPSALIGPSAPWEKRIRDLQSQLSGEYVAGNPVEMEARVEPVYQVEYSKKPIVGTRR